MLRRDTMNNKIRYAAVAAVLIAAFAVLCSIPDDEAIAASPLKTTGTKSAVSNKKSDKAKQNIKVTFIELGSLNCIPCKMMQPIIKEIEEEYKETVKVEFYDVQSSEGRPYAEKYKIRMIPTQVFLDKDGKEYYRHVGFFPKDEIEKILSLRGVKK
jgi:thioredoxin 1